ncbi:short chain dehydrogenase family protein [Mycobacteroides abscessus 1948]|uniref:Short chain dehydrogenase family protein n=1 Tax=Mycobacteroides abscessus 1948 TaxID=1299323 RepID=A0A829QME4_9MYCO|nr:short chain dehydrogenase family protein [Mycobacteroides abscessus 1948]
MPVAVVTGAGSGIGRATAERFGRKGWTIVVSDINEATGAETVDRITRTGGSAVFRRLDVADLEDWRQFTDWVCEEHGTPDLLVNNAGILIAGGFLEQTGADWRRMIAINMMSPLVGSRLFVQRMVEAGARATSPTSVRWEPSCRLHWLPLTSLPNKALGSVPRHYGPNSVSAASASARSVPD